jgi:hypothetical protein
MDQVHMLCHDVMCQQQQQQLGQVSIEVGIQLMRHSLRQVGALACRNLSCAGFQHKSCLVCGAITTTFCQGIFMVVYTPWPKPWQKQPQEPDVS